MQRTEVEVEPERSLHRHSCRERAHGNVGWKSRESTQRGDRHRAPAIGACAVEVGRQGRRVKEGALSHLGEAHVTHCGSAATLSIAHVVLHQARARLQATAPKRHS